MVTKVEKYVSPNGYNPNITTYKVTMSHQSATEEPELKSVRNKSYYLPLTAANKTPVIYDRIIW